MKKENTIYEQINKSHFRGHVSFHMPGHKGRGEFKFLFPVAGMDITELSYSDDLQNPTGCIAQAEQDIAEALGAKKSYITTDGSSSGVMAMLYVASKFGSKIIVPRNSHKSVFNACRLFGLEPVVVQGEDRGGILMPPSVELITMLVVNDVSIAGMVAVSPDYYGNVSPLQDYAKAMHANGRFLFVDGAHGTHLALTDEDKPLHASAFADMWVDGAHKSLPTLTQGAILSVNNEKLQDYAQEAMGIFRTTSPSYPIMASVEYGVKFALKNKASVKRVRQAVDDFKKGLQGFVVYPNQDWTKLVVDCKPTGVSSHVIQAFLEKKGLYPEMSDGRYLTFYLSYQTEASDLNALRSALLGAIRQRSAKNTYKERPTLPVGSRSYSFLFALKQKKEWVALPDAVGKMCACNCGITPPCTPVLIAGEMVTKEAVELLSQATDTFGLQEGKILVVKK